MSAFYAAQAGPREISYLFIDGGALREMMERLRVALFPAEPALPVDYNSLGNGFTKIFYYDCPPPQGSAESQAEYEPKLREYEESMRKLRSLSGWHVFEGITKRKGKKATQKEVDVLIAVDMLTHTYRRNMHRLAFIAGDQDFRPLLEAVVREGMFVELRYDVSSASRELLDAADARLPLDCYSLFAWLDAPFRWAHPLPRRSADMERIPPGAVVVRTGRTGSNDPVELMHWGAEFLIVHPDPLNSGHFNRMTHADRDLLQRVYERACGVIEWRE